MAEQKITGTLQENLLALMSWSETSFQLVRNSVTPELFSTDVFRDIVTQVYEFIDAHRKPPKDHLPDLLEKQFKGKDGDLYKDLCRGVNRFRKTMNEEYILKQLATFVRQQNLKITIIEAGDLIRDGKLDEAEVAIEKGLKQRLQLFDPGMDMAQALSYISKRDTLRDSLPLGIPELDPHELGPAPGELYSLLGPKKGGKSWWLGFLAKRSLMMGEPVVVASLELSRELYLIRMMQAIYSLTLREGQKAYRTFLEKDELGRVTGFRKEKINRDALMSLAGRKRVKRGIHRWTPLLKVQQFPTGELTISQLKAYLDGLERMHRFMPKMLIVDYPKLMKHSADNLRIELGTTLERLRGIAVERNIRVCVVGQVNREGVRRGTSSGTDAAEDFSINHTSDVVVTYSQTPAEYQLGLARLGVDASRISKQHINLMISQSYDIGQFCLDSAPLASNYQNMVKDETGKEMGDDPD